LSCDSAISGGLVVQPQLQEESKWISDLAVEDFDDGEQQQQQQQQESWMQRQPGEMEYIETLEFDESDEDDDAMVGHPFDVTDAMMLARLLATQCSQFHDLPAALAGSFPTANSPAKDILTNNLM
jgi:hypothetical protein